MATWKPFKEIIIVFILSFFVGLASIVLLIIETIRKGPKAVFCVKERLVLPDVLCDESYGKHEYIKLKNRRIKLHCVIGGAKDKPLMLFLHGFPQFWYSWRHQIKEFQNDFRTCAVDMRGYGDSDKPRKVEDYTLVKLVGDIEELITTLGYKKCVLVGHDWGGAVAWHFVANHPEMVSKFVACNIPHPEVFFTAIKTTFAQLRKSWYMFLFQVPYLPSIILRMNDFGIFDLSMKKRTKAGSFTDQDIEAYKYTFNDFTDFDGPLSYYKAVFRYHSYDTMPRIFTPTLLIWGNNDVAFCNDLPHNSAKHVEDFSLKIVEGATHWVQEEFPQQVNESIRQFLF